MAKMCGIVTDDYPVEETLLNCIAYANREGVLLSGLVLNKKDFEKLKLELGAPAKEAKRIQFLTCYGTIKIIEDKND